jgi:hypothetical protein
VIEVPELPVDHLLGMDVVREDDEVIVAWHILSNLLSVILLDGAVLPSDELLGTSTVGHRLVHDLIIIGTHAYVEVSIPLLGRILVC